MSTDVFCTIPTAGVRCYVTIVTFRGAACLRAYNLGNWNLRINKS